MTWLPFRRRHTDGLADRAAGLGAEHVALSASCSREHARISQALVRATAASLSQGLDEASLVRAYCDAITGASEHIRMVWTWFGPQSATQIVPQVSSGPAQDYARQLTIDRTFLTERGPAFRAIAGQAPEPFNVSVLSPYPAWRQLARDWGVRSVLCNSITSTDPAQCGLFALYADTPDYFVPSIAGLFAAVGDLFGSILSNSMQMRQLQAAAHTDALTQLPNRRGLDGFTEALLKPGSRPAELALLVVDLDHFKRVNDSHGHLVGDEVLKHTAALLRAGLRHSDFVGRFGGEEFVLCLPGADRPAALDQAERIRQRLGAAHHVGSDGREFRVSASIGVAMVQPGEALQAALGRADQALYDAKRQGRDRVVLAAPHTGDTARADDGTAPATAA